jgi:hypothetical protein
MPIGLMAAAKDITVPTLTAAARENPAGILAAIIAGIGKPLSALFFFYFPTLPRGKGDGESI